MKWFLQMLSFIEFHKIALHGARTSDLRAHCRLRTSWGRRSTGSGWPSPRPRPPRPPPRGVGIWPRPKSFRRQCDARGHRRFGNLTSEWIRRAHINIQCSTALNLSIRPSTCLRVLSHYVHFTYWCVCESTCRTDLFKSWKLKKWFLDRPSNHFNYLSVIFHKKAFREQTYTSIIWCCRHVTTHHVTITGVHFMVRSGFCEYEVNKVRT